jgi:hypothetical protein
VSFPVLANVAKALQRDAPSLDVSIASSSQLVRFPAVTSLPNGISFQLVRGCAHNQTAHKPLYSHCTFNRPHIVSLGCTGHDLHRLLVFPAGSSCRHHAGAFCSPVRSPVPSPVRSTFPAGKLPAFLRAECSALRCPELRAKCDAVGCAELPAFISAKCDAKLRAEFVAECGAVGCAVGCAELRA